MATQADERCTAGYHVPDNDEGIAVRARLAALNLGAATGFVFLAESLVLPLLASLPAQEI